MHRQHLCAIHDILRHIYEWTTGSHDLPWKPMHAYAQCLIL